MLDGRTLHAAADVRTFQLTISFGVTLLDPDMPVEQSIDRADKALYVAKATGQDRTVTLGWVDERAAGAGSVGLTESPTSSTVLKCPILERRNKLSNTQISGHSRSWPLKLLKSILHEGHFVFESPTHRRPLSNMAMLQLLRDIRGDRSTVHGFRSSFRDWAADKTDVAREVFDGQMDRLRRRALRLQRGMQQGTAQWAAWSSALDDAFGVVDDMMRISAEGCRDKILVHAALVPFPR